MNEDSFVNEDFQIHIDGAEAVITLCRRHTGNMLSLTALRRLTETIDAFPARDPIIKVLRIRAEGESFCLGRAPASPNAPPPASSQEMRERLIDPILGLYRAIRAWDMPVVAEVQGDAAGLGCAVVAACDLAIAGSTARFSLPEMDKGLPPTLALSALSRKVHAKAAASMVWGLAQFDATTAQAIGLVGEVVSAERLTERVDEVVAHIVRQHPLALATIKKYLRSLHSADAEVSAELAGGMLANALSSTRSSSPAVQGKTDEK
jgi:enoyl-CoA hydratase